MSSTFPAPDEKRCVHSNASGERCRKYRMNESTLCRTHGSAPHILSAVQRRQAGYDAKMRALRKYEKEGPVEISGAEAVIELLEERMGKQVQMARALDEVVGKLTAEEAIRYEGRAGEQIRGEVQVWIQIQQMLTKLGADYLKIGLDERKVRIAEAQARVLIGVIQAVMARLDLTSSQRRIAAQAIPEELQRASIESGK
jgi:tRNA(Ile2) C34 agmatinyltransferase TiaS